MAALEALERNPRNWGRLLIHIINVKLDEMTLSEWEAKLAKTEIAHVPLFLDQQSELQEAIESSKNMVKGIKYPITENSVTREKNKINKKKQHQHVVNCHRGYEMLRV